MKLSWERILTFIVSMKGRTIGIVIGILFGFLYLIFGFWKVLIFAGFVALGYFLGSIWDSNEDWRDVMDRILPPK